MKKKSDSIQEANGEDLKTLAKALDVFKKVKGIDERSVLLMAKNETLILRAGPFDGVFVQASISSKGPDWEKPACLSLPLLETAFAESPPNSSVMILYRLRKSGGTFNIKTLHDIYRLPLLPLEISRNPRLGEIQGSAVVPMPIFRRYIDLAAMSAEDSYANPSLSGVAFKRRGGVKGEKVSVYCSDGNRLSLISFKPQELEGDFDALFKPHAVQAATRLFESLGLDSVSMEIYPGGARFSGKGAWIWVPRLDSETIDIEPVLDMSLLERQDSASCRIERKLLEDALRKVSLHADVAAAYLRVDGAVLYVESPRRSNLSVVTKIAAREIHGDWNKAAKVMIATSMFREALRAGRIQDVLLSFPSKDSTCRTLSFTSPEMSEFLYIQALMTEAS